MKTTIYFFLFIIPLVSLGSESEQTKRKKNDWYQQFDHRLSQIENSITVDIQEINNKQDQLNHEMVRLNEKLENRFDKYFLWGYGTILVILSTVVNVVFSRRKTEKTILEDKKELAAPGC